MGCCCPAGIGKSRRETLPLAGGRRAAAAAALVAAERRPAAGSGSVEGKWPIVRFKSRSPGQTKYFAANRGVQATWSRWTGSLSEPIAMPSYIQREKVKLCPLVFAAVDGVCCCCCGCCDGAFTSVAPCRLVCSPHFPPKYSPQSVRRANRTAGSSRG